MARHAIRGRHKLYVKTREQSPSDDSYNSEEDFSDNAEDSEEGDLENLFSPTEISMMARYVNKVLLLGPLVTSLVFRSIASSDFRVLTIAWALILAMASDISMDEGVFPALVSASLGCTNAVVAQNMYISIARSRLGLLTLFLLSYYSSNYQIFVCGILLKLLVVGFDVLLQKSIPKSELTLICGALVNVIFALKSLHPGDIFNYSAIIASGIAAAIPCYPLLARFTRKYRLSHGTAKQPQLVTAVYVLHFSVAVYLYFFTYGANLVSIISALRDNLYLILYWGICLGIALLIAYYQGDRIGLDGRRKLWHLTTVVMFLPQEVRERKFTNFALAVAIVLFLALEVARATALPPFGIPLHRILQSFIDHRDNQGPVIISHIYLLLGISVPIFLGKSCAGVICLGLGDTFASQIGRRFGRFRIFGHKSIEGCIAFAVAAGCGAYLFDNESQVLWSVIPTAILEAVTPLNDNLAVPMYMLALQGIFKNRH